MLNKGAEDESMLFWMRGMDVQRRKCKSKLICDIDLLFCDNIRDDLEKKNFSSVCFKTQNIIDVVCSNLTIKVNIIVREYTPKQ